MGSFGLAKKLLLSISIVMLCTRAVRAQEDSTYAENVEAYAQLLRAEGEFLRAVAAARLDLAKSWLIEAQAAGEWVKVKQLQLLVERLNLELYRLKKQEYKLLKKAETIEKWAKQANKIVGGLVNSYSLQGLKVLILNYIPPAKVLAAMTLPAPPIKQLMPLGKGEPMDFAGGNVGQLVEFLREYNLTVEPWSPGHIALVEAMITLAAGVDEQLAIIQDLMDQLHEGADPFDLTVPWLSDSEEKEDDEDKDEK